MSKIIGDVRTKKRRLLRGDMLNVLYISKLSWGKKIRVVYVYPWAMENPMTWMLQFNSQIILKICDILHTLIDTRNINVNKMKFLTLRILKSTWKDNYMANVNV